MPKMSVNTIVAEPPSGKPLGSRHEQNLKGIFASSPLYSQASTQGSGQGAIKLTPSDLKQWYIDNVVNGVVPGSEGYYGLATAASMDFVDAPNLADVKTGGGGLPATPFVPNPASPGEGNGTNPFAQSESKDFATQISAKTPTTPGSGAAANDDARNPSSTSKAMKTKVISTLGQSPASAKS